MLLVKSFKGCLVYTNQVVCCYYLSMLKVHTGPMFSGKTTGLLKDLNNALERGLKCVFVRPSTDERKFLTHDGKSLPKNKNLSVVLVDPGFYLSDIEWADFYAVDEVQFFAPIEIVSSIKTLIGKGKEVSVSGLDLDALGEPFGCVPTLLCLAEEVIKHSGQCDNCNAGSSRTYCKIDLSNNNVYVGGNEEYQPKCLKCWTKLQSLKTGS